MPFLVPVCCVVVFSGEDWTEDRHGISPVTNSYEVSRLHFVRILELVSLARFAQVVI